ncbi:MAG TPA: alkaline phosphatase family protein [Anaerolineae bacterium]|nr:alkaline phosphatase family protein [Anaerolineae bacterium]
MSKYQLPSELVAPDYAGGSIANVPATVAKLMGVPFAGLPPLREPLWADIGEGVKRVVVIIIDAWGWNLFQREQARLESLLSRAKVVSQLTSVFPSTTVNALSCLWTGLAPAQHGLVGLRILMPEQGVLGQMLQLGPNFTKVPGSLVTAGVEPEAFLTGLGMAEQLAAGGVPTYAFKGWEIVDSALSKMHGRGVAGNYGAYSFAHMMMQVRTLLEEKAGESLYACAYWPMVDTLSHEYGWDGEVVAAELEALVGQIERILLDGVSGAGGEGTAVFVVADHGQIVLPREQRLFLREHRALQEMMLMRAGGEPRTLYAYARQGRVDDIIAYCEAHWSEGMWAWPTEAVLAAGLLGPKPYAAEAALRLGDVVISMREGYVLLNPDEEKKAEIMMGRHGGLTAAEMEVPLLGFRLDS